MKLKHQLIIALLALAIILGCAVWLVRGLLQSEVSVAVDDTINITPEQITSIEAIGEWEFLSIANEELVDTTRKGLFSDDHLVRIYYGTVRLGIDMHQVESDWIKTTGDSIDITLPKIDLLDRNFIDEARTKSFFESGKWTQRDREALYQRAYRQMLSHCLTADNLRQARDNGEGQFRRMMQSMGFHRVRIRFQQ